jgi:lysophospholipase L1-like esterase
MIGDLGLVYDRWYAYPRRKESPASYYPSDSVEVVTDMTHPSDEGTKQIAEGIAPCILKMMQ